MFKMGKQMSTWPGTIWFSLRAILIMQIDNVNPHPTPQPPPQGPGNMRHRWGISEDLSIEQAPGGRGLANFGKIWKRRTETRNIWTWLWFNWFNMVEGESQWLNICSHLNNSFWFLLFQKSTSFLTSDCYFCFCASSTSESCIEYYSYFSFHELRIFDNINCTKYKMT